MLRRFAVDEWRLFGGRRFRLYHYLAMAQGIVGVLAGFDVVIPFALAMGTPPFVAVLLGVLPLAAGATPLVVPRLLDRTAGNLRGLTIFVAALGETRGLLYAGLAVLVGVGVVGGPLTVVALATIIGVASVLSAIGSANLLAWHAGVLPESERRLVVPRLFAVSLAMGAALLLPLSLVLDSIVDRVGLAAYALPFGIAGAVGVVEVLVITRLRHPGTVIVPPAALGASSPETPDLARFLRVSTINALGMGIAPAMSVYTISIVGLSAGFSMLLGSIGTLTMVVGAAAAGTRIAAGSADEMVRRSFAIRALAMFAPILALPGTVTAPLFLIASSMLGAIGYASGTIAANERLYRLLSGPAVIRHQGRYLAQTNGAMTAGQVVGAAVLAAGGPFGYPAYALLYGLSTGLRLTAFRLAAPGVAREQEAAAPVAEVAAPVPAQEPQPA